MGLVVASLVVACKYHDDDCDIEVDYWDDLSEAAGVASKTSSTDWESHRFGILKPSLLSYFIAFE